MKKVLISSIGEAPGVITGTIDLLEEDGIQIEEVYVIGTEDFDVQKCMNFLAKWIPARYQNRVKFIPDWISKRDVDDQESNIEFMQKACQLLRLFRYRNWDVYLSLAGGRKTMSAIMTIAAQSYNAKALCHIIIPPWIEENGHITKIEDFQSRGEQDRINEVLHPRKTLLAQKDPDADEVKLVKLPFISTYPLLLSFIEMLKNPDKLSPSETEKVARELLISTGMLSRTKGAYQATDLGKQYLEILETIELMPPPTDLSTDQKQEQIPWGDHNLEGQEERLKSFVQKLLESSYVTGIRSERFVSRADARPRFEPRSDGSIAAYFPLGGKSIKLILSTTAGNEHQAQLITDRDLKRRIGL